MTAPTDSTEAILERAAQDARAGADAIGRAWLRAEASLVSVYGPDSGVHVELVGPTIVGPGDEEWRYYASASSSIYRHHGATPEAALKSLADALDEALKEAQGG
jgi:hypothetical protein